MQTSRLSEEQKKPNEPTSAAKDSAITITGTNFSTAIDGNIVTINNMTATVLAAAAIFQYLYTVTTLAGDGNYRVRKLE